MQLCKQLKKIRFMDVFVVFSFAAIGLFHEFLACISGIALSIYLCRLVAKQGGMRFYVNLTSIAVLLIVCFYGLSVFWAVDSGEAFIGFFKFLPLLLFMLVLMQDPRQAAVWLKTLPYLAAFITVVSAVLMQVPVLERYFSTAGRLSGTFQYANTFALFLLVAILLIATKEKFSRADFVMLPILLFGLIYSGSRTVFALMIVSVVALLVFKKNKKHRLALAGLVAAAVGVSAGYAVLTGNFSSIGRFLTTSLTESTFVGRFLYFYDALPVILKHPFGLGYMGYSYMQYSFQTGVYTVRFIHNDFLQLLLDVGWIPTGAFVAAVFKSFFKKGTSLTKRLLLFVITAHTCFDFNFQYLAIFMLFILLLNYNDGEEKELSLTKTACGTVAVLLSVCFLYIGVGQGLSYFKIYTLSDRIYPWCTRNHIAMLASADAGNSEKLADRVIKNNGYVALAYRVKAGNSYSEGDFREVIQNEKKAIQVSPFSYETYEEYCYFLINGIILYEKAGDTYSAEVCREELNAVAEQLKELPNRCSKLGRMIQDQPQTELPPDIQEYIGETDDEE